MTSRFAVLREYQLTWPTVDATTLAGLLRWLMLLLIVLGAGWALSGTLTRLARPGDPKANAVGGGELEGTGSR
jgi:hypothetical protein